jgi:hypothetical protein
MSRLARIVIALLLAAGWLAAPSAATASTCWSHTPGVPPNPGTVHNSLVGIAALSACDAWAVGGRSNNEKFGQPLIEHWDGNSWKQVKSPNPGGSSAATDLLDVAAISTRDAWAVGDYDSSGTLVPLTIHWNGTRWKVVTTPIPTGGTGILDAVSAVSTSDVWAVGETCPGCNTDETLTYHWNGTAWKRIASPNATDFDALRSVSVVSTDDVWAVGDSFNGSATQSLTMHWNGIKWKIVPSPDPGGADNQNILFGVSARSANNAWAVGKYFDGSDTLTLAMHWNGTKWKRVVSPNPSDTNNAFSGVVTLSRRNAWAVGGAVDSAIATQTLVEHWNGKHWRVVTSPDPGTTSGFNTLNALAALSPSRIWAVGSYDGGTQGKCLAITLP